MNFRVSGLKLLSPSEVLAEDYVYVIDTNPTDGNVKSKKVSIIGLIDYRLANSTGSNYVLLSGFYTDPSFIASLSWSKITGAPTFLSSALVSLNGLTGASQTFVNDTNLTVVSTGTTHTITWAGTLADSRITSSSNWNTAYSNRITSLTTIGSSGVSTLSSNVLNIPEYTLAGLGGISLTSLSSTATGLTYNNATGVFSLTSGYAIPTTANASNWDTAYTNRITSLTTTGSSGGATLVANVLNVPQYTLSGLGGQPLANNLTSLASLTYSSASFLKMTAAGTFALDTNTYIISGASAGGDLTGTYPNPIVDGLQGNPVSNTPPLSGQVLQWNGSAWIPGANPTGGSGGGGLVYYFNYQNTTGISPTTGLPTSPVAVSQLGISYSVGSGIITSANLVNGSYSLICGFVTIAGNPGVTNIPAGLWDFNIWVDVDGNTGSSNQTQFQIRVYKYNSTTGVYTSLGNSDDVYVYDPVTIAQYIANVTIPQTTILSTDRIYVELWGQKNVSQSRALRFYFDSTHPSHFHTTLPSVSGSGIVKVVNGVFQSPASLIGDADVSPTAAIAISKLSMSTSKLLGRTTSGAGSVEEINVTTTGNSGAASLSGTNLNIPNYTLAGLGGVAVTTFNGQTGTVSATATSGIVVYEFTGAGSLVLPTAVSNTAIFMVKNRHTSNITVTFTGGQNADGTTSITLIPFQALQFISNNSNYNIF